MKRINPIGSLLGIILTILLFLGLGISLWFDRGLAFSPGLVTEKRQVGVKLEGYTSHADFEKQCGKCHDPIRTTLSTKCLECHIDVMQQIKSAQGVHSQISTINSCATCHPEHRGRNFDPTLASFQLFDHSKASFSLVWHQSNYDATPMECRACHLSADLTIFSSQTCRDCHARSDHRFSDAHIQDYGSDCLGCHDGSDRMQNFVHSQTGFPLDGKHSAIKCTDCHNVEDVAVTSQECKGCHAEPEIHLGQFEQPCDSCHTAQGWSPAILESRPFGHLETAAFSLSLHQLDYSGQAITCTTCHPLDLQSFNTQICVDCHTQHDLGYMVDHTEQFGVQCLVCHDGIDRMSNFQHANFFPLDGKHASLRCTECHVNEVYRGTPKECWQCHIEPEIHANIFGLKCEYCHDTTAWSPASLQQHTFPLTHGIATQGTQLECDACHGSNYIDYSCYNCHDHQQASIERSHKEEGIPAQDLPACATCHPDGKLTDADTNHN